MRKIWNLLRKHWKEDFDPMYYLSIGVFLALSLIFNYAVGLENQVIDRFQRQPIRIFWYFLLYGAAYFGALALTVFFKKRKDVGRSTQFWFLSLTGIFLLAISSGFPYVNSLVRLFDADLRTYTWFYSILSNSTGFVLVTIPLVILNIFSRANNHMNGLGVKGFDVKPYLVILLFILPVIILSSFEDSFQSYYPTYKVNEVAEVFHWPRWFPMALYETVYGLDFFNTEFMYRGFLVIGLSQILGKDAIMPMVVAYCYLHFGKPVGEAISSIVGGYILGVIAFYSRSIWGGVIVHIGLAWMMELAAYLQRII